MEYEELVQMIGLIRAATSIGFGRENDLPDSILDDLTEIQNKLNNQRLEMLGNGRSRPFDVDDLIRSLPEPPS